MNYLEIAAFVVIMIHLAVIQHQVRLLRSQMNRLAGPPTDTDRAAAHGAANLD